MRDMADPLLITSLLNKVVTVERRGEITELALAALQAAPEGLDSRQLAKAVMSVEQSHARKLIRASAAAFDAGQRKRAADLLAHAGAVVAEIKTAIG